MCKEPVEKLKALSLVDILKKNIINEIERMKSAKNKNELRQIYIKYVYRNYIKVRYKLELYEDELFSYVAQPDEINVRNISPKIVRVDGNRKLRLLFRYLTFYWSFPVSEGVGRRIKFIIFDEYNNKVIGLIGLRDPVIGLKARDKWIGWNLKEKKKYLWHVMDAGVLGAIPPYSQLLGGKLISSILISKEIRKEIERRYGLRHGFSVVLYTTITVYGKSSMLSRLKYWHFIGYTTGKTTVHIDFDLLKQLLISNNDPEVKKYKFGDGPNWKLRLARKASKILGFDITDVGIRRGIYAAPLANNFREALRGIEKPNYYDFSITDISEYVKERYMIPRSKRIKLYPPLRVSTIMKMVRSYES